MSKGSQRPDPDALDRMRRFVADVMTQRPASVEPPGELVRQGHLGPIAYKMGFAEHRAEYAASAIMAERRAAVLREVVSAFRDAGIRVALIKGVSLSGTLYEDPAERPMHDIDLLIRSRTVPEVMRCMVKLGFEPVGAPRRLSGYYHALTYRKGGMMVDVHRYIVQPGRTGLRSGDLWRRAVPDVKVAGAERLNAVDNLLVSSLSIARHELFVPALNYVDVVRAMAALGDGGASQVLDRAQAYRAGMPVTAVLSMADLLRQARSGSRPVLRFDRLLPSTDELLLGTPPGRARQLAQRLVLTGGPREVAGLTFATVRALADGWLRQRG